MRTDSKPAAPAPCSFRGLIGVSRADITPPAGIYSRNWGAAAHDASESVHGSLTLTALTIRHAEGGDPLVLIDADLGWFRTLRTFRAWRDRVLQQFGITQDRFIFALSHTHASVPLSEDLPDLPGTDLVVPYLERVLDTMLNAIRSALASERSATLEWTMGHCDLAANRDLPDPAGDRIICGFNPSVAADDTLVVGRATDSEGEILATIVNYACHPTTLAWDNRAISPDFPGAMRATMEAVTKAPALFLQGASGELSPRLQYVGNTKIADRHGRQLAYSALATLEGMEPAGKRLEFEGVVESGAPLAVWKQADYAPDTELQAIRSTVDLPLKGWPTADELETQRQACTDRALAERLLRRRDIRRSLGDGQSFELPIWAWRIGNCVLIGTMMESYSILQTTLRQSFPHNVIVCMNLINGTMGYLPPSEAYAHDLYQAWQTPFEKSSLERLIDAMDVLVRRLISD